MLVLADALVHATWGLVVATALLVVAALIPAIRALLEPRHDARRTTVALIPDMHILGSRIRGEVEELGALASLEDEERREMLESVYDTSDEDLEMLSELIEHAGGAGLEFVNELYVCRHLITQAQIDMRWCIALCAR